jgi:hypothetical protein
MARKSGNIISSILSVAALALIALAVIFFFFPDLSENILGTSWNPEEVSMPAPIAEAVDAAQKQETSRSVPPDDEGAPDTQPTDDAVTPEDEPDPEPAVEDSGSISSQLEAAGDDLSQRLNESGVTDEQIDEVISQLDRESIMAAAQQAMQSGGDLVENFVDSLDQRIDFGNLDTEVLKKTLGEKFDQLDFSQTMQLMGEFTQGGIESLESTIREMFE